MPSLIGHPGTSSQSPRTPRSRQPRRWFEQLRQRRPWLDIVLKIAITTVGVLLIIAGIIIAPLPGPGGFIAFFGIAMLATEFIWARRAVRKSQAVGHRWHLRLTGRRPRWAYRWKRRKQPSQAT